MCHVIEASLFQGPLSSHSLCGQGGPGSHVSPAVRGRHSPGLRPHGAGKQPRAWGLPTPFTRVPAGAGGRGGQGSTGGGGVHRLRCLQGRGMHRHRFPLSPGLLPHKTPEDERAEAGTLMPCRVSDGDRMVTFWKVSLACYGGKHDGHKQ